MDKWQDKFKQLAVSFQELLECPVCFGLMDSTLKLCINGHGICNSCATKIEKCPTCQQALDSVLRQNTLLGQLLERLPKPCPYSDKGCDSVVSDQDHQTYCEYRPTRCLKHPCEWEGCVKDLLEHVMSCKKGNAVIALNEERTSSRSYTFGASQSKAFFTPIVYNNQVFWKHFQRDGVTKCIYHQLYHISTTKQSCDYYMVISFKSGNIEFKHSCKAIPYSDDQNENEEIKYGITIPDCDLKKFLVSGTTQSYSYTMELVEVHIP